MAVSKKVTITLDDPVIGHDGPIRNVILREPCYRDIMGHGKPYSVHRGPDGNPIIINDEEALAHYANACVVEPVDHTLLWKCSLSDTMKIREAVLDFFLQPAAAGAGSKTSRETSGSEPASSPTQSGK